MNIIVVGSNHKYSPIQIREQFSFGKNKIRNALVGMVSCRGIESGVILSTCNRVELYATTKDTKTAILALKEFLSDYHHKESGTIEPYLYTYIGKQAIQHLFRVAAGTDSQIIGERQILEQVRSAYQEARSIEATDSLLDTVFDNAMRVSLRVRQETGITEGKVSIASVITDLIKSECNLLKNKKILIIGVGKISESVTRHLKKEGAETLFIANRTYDKALLLAKDIGAGVLRFNGLKEKLLDADIVISATSSPHLIVKKGDLEAIKKPLLIIDLAVPRDVDPQARYIKGVRLFSLDDLGFIIEDNLQKRRQSIPPAADIINKEVENLCLDGSLKLEPELAPLP